MKKLNYKRLFELIIFPISIICGIYFLVHLNRLEDLMCLWVCMEITILSGYDIIKVLRGVK